MFWKQKNELRVLQIRTGMIRFGDTSSPRYDEDALSQLMTSIEKEGIIQPLMAYRKPMEMYYTLVAGRRRLEAAKRLNLVSVPVLVVPADRAMMLTLLENQHRAPQNCFEDAERIEHMMKATGWSAQTVAASLGYSEETMREKRQILRLKPAERVLCSAANLTQEMAKRILAMPASERDRLFFGLLNETSSLEDRIWLLHDRLGVGRPAPLRGAAIKDVRIFFNTIDKALDLMQRSGVEATSERHDYDGLVEYYIRIPSGQPDAKSV